jgi:hypothetical protein
MIIYTLPKSARLIPTDNTFSAQYNLPTLSVYNFNIAANADQVCFPIQGRTVYFVDSLQIGGNIASETFLSVIQSQPYITFKKLLSGEVVFTQKIPISVFSSSITIGAFLQSPRENDALTITFNGVLLQNSDLVGISPITINIKVNVYAMDETSYQTMFERREFFK